MVCASTFHPARGGLMVAPKTAVILAATEGTRMRPLTQYFPKVLLPIRDKPILVHHLEQLEKCGVLHIVITLEPRLGSMIRTAIERGYDGKGQIVFLTQRKRGGLGYALLQCRKFLDHEPFVFTLADEYSESGNFYSALRDKKYVNYDGMLSIIKAPSKRRISETASIGLDWKTQEVIGYIEKPAPKQITGNRMFAGAGLFPQEFLDILEALKKKKTMYIRDELSIGNAIQTFLDEGFRIRYVEETGRHVHLTTVKDFFEHPG